MCRIATSAATAKSTAGSRVRADKSADKAAATGGRGAVALEMFASTPVTRQRRRPGGVIGGGSGHDSNIHKKRSINGTRYPALRSPDGRRSDVVRRREESPEQGFRD